MEPFDLPSDSSTRQRVLAPNLEPDVNCAAAVGLPVLISANDDVAEWLARLIHDRSDRSAEPFVVFRPGSGDALGLLRSLLNGSGPARGTLFLSDISRAGRDVQAKLRDWLLTQMPDTGPRLRILASTSAWLYERVERGEFDDRLFYRLNKIHIRVGTRDDTMGVAPASTDRPDVWMGKEGMDVATSRRNRMMLRAGHSAQPQQARAATPR